MSLRRRRTLHEVPADDSNGDHGTTLGPDLTDASPDPEATYLQKEGARILSAAIRHLRPGMHEPSSCGNWESYQLERQLDRWGSQSPPLKARVSHARKELGKALRYQAVSLEGRS